MPPAEKNQPVDSKDIDEHWLMEWVALGLREIECLLAKHTAFAEYLKKKERE